MGHTLILFDGGLVVKIATLEAPDDRRALGLAIEACDEMPASTGFELWRDHHRIAVHLKRLKAA